MGKIIQFDSSQKRPKPISKEKRDGCEHKQVIAYSVYRTVRCSICGIELDPFDVLVDLLKAHVPIEKDELEEKKLLREVEKRSETATNEED